MEVANTVAADVVKKIVTIVLILIATAILYWILRLIKKKQGKNIHVRFTSQFIMVALVVSAGINIIGILDSSINTMSTILRSSALVIAIVGFAAQPAILDLISGYLISVNKPFEIGDRIVIEGQGPGIVEDITLRHTVLRIYDDIRIIVPNSVLNGKIVQNTSYKNGNMKIHLRFLVSYDTDVEKASEIIRDCVVASPYTLGVVTNNIQEDSRQVYFLEFAGSALVLETTIDIRRNSSTYEAVTDVNKRVIKAFEKYGIEIPYDYINVMERQYSETESSEYHRSKGGKPIRRNYRTQNIAINDLNYMPTISETCRSFAKKQYLSDKAGEQLLLLSEESINLVYNIIGKVKIKYWIDGTGLLYRIHLRINATAGASAKNALSSLASQYEDKTSWLTGQIWDFVQETLLKEDGMEHRWSLKDSKTYDDISKSLLTSLSDDILVTVDKEYVYIIVIGKALK